MDLEIRMNWKIVVLAILVGSSADAGEIVAGLGIEDALDQSSSLDTSAALIEYRMDTRYHLGPVGFGLAAAGEVGAGYWAGAGIYAAWPVTRDLRVLASVMPGIYDERRDRWDLGGPVEIRSAIEASYAFRPDYRIGISFEHKSNAGIYEHNPGIETLFLAVSHSF